MPSQPQQDELLSAYLDGELSDDERRAVEERLRGDPAAQRTLDELRTLADALRALPRATPPAGAADAIRARLERRALVDGPAGAGRAGAAGQGAGREGAGGFRHWRRLAYAASLMLAAGAGIWAVPSLWEQPRIGTAGSLTMKSETGAGGGSAPRAADDARIADSSRRGADRDAASQQLAMRGERATDAAAPRAAARPHTPVDKQTAKALRQLGYLDVVEESGAKAKPAEHASTADELLARVEQAGRTDSPAARSNEGVRLADAEPAIRPTDRIEPKASPVGGAALGAAPVAPSNAAAAPAASPPAAVSPAESAEADSRLAFAKKEKETFAGPAPVPGADDYALTWTVADASRVRPIVDAVTRQAADLQIPAAGGAAFAARSAARSDVAGSGGAGVEGAAAGGASDGRSGAGGAGAGAGGAGAGAGGAGAGALNARAGEEAASIGESVAVTRFDDGGADLQITAPASRVKRLLAALAGRSSAGVGVAARLPPGVESSIASPRLALLLRDHEAPSPAAESRPPSAQKTGSADKPTAVALQPARAAAAAPAKDGSIGQQAAGGQQPAIEQLAAAEQRAAAGQLAAAGAPHPSRGAAAARSPGGAAVGEKRQRPLDATGDGERAVAHKTRAGPQRERAAGSAGPSTPGANATADAKAPAADDDANRRLQAASDALARGRAPAQATEAGLLAGEFGAGLPPGAAQPDPPIRLRLHIVSRPVAASRSALASPSASSAPAGAP